MTAPAIIQPAFAAGELAPGLHARVDLAKYHTGAKLLRNFFVQPSGGVSNRPGTMFVGRAKDSAHPVRLIPFEFSTVQTYMLEFGHQYMRVIKDGGYVLEPAVSVLAVTNGNPCRITVSGTPFNTGDWVTFFNVGGMPQINAVKAFIVTGAISGSFTLSDLDGNPVDSSTWGSFTSGGTVARIFTLTTPYAGSDLAALKFTQSADVMTLCHTGYAPYDLSRTQHWVWSLNAVTFQAKISAPTGVSLAAAGSNSTAPRAYYYAVTAVTDSPYEESVPSSVASISHYALDQNAYVVITISWSAVAGASRYKIYKSAGGSYGYIGSTTGASFVDTNIEADFSQGPPSHNNPFASGNNPGCAEYHEQRKCFAGSSSGPETVWMSKPGNFTNMDTSYPSRDDDAVTLTIASRQVNAIKHLLPMQDLIALTGGGAFKISPGGSADSLTPSSVTVKPQSQNGCSDVRPIIVGNDVLYVQSKGSIVRDLSYDYYTSVYTGADMTIMASHLFFGYQIVDWAYAEEPFKLVWAVRNDGILLTFTYLKDQQVYAWTQGYTTNGLFKAAASVSEGTENAVYFVVQRTINGNTVQYVERLASRNFQGNVALAWFVDCGLQYSGNPVTTVSGLDHLNGQTVAILADGNVMPQQVVSGGSVTLPLAASIITVGLPYSAAVQTLDLDVPAAGGGTVQGKRKKVSAVTIRMENTRGLKVGPNASSLKEIKERNAGNMGGPIPLTTGDERIVIPPVWQSDGTIWVQQDNPLPCSVLATMPEITMGDGAGG
jgi:hypothetical protein